MEKIRHTNTIGGWLWLPAIALMIQPLSFFTGILPSFKSQGPNILLTFNLPVLIGDIVILSMVAIVAWIYFNRKKIAPGLYILQIIIMVLMWEIMDGLIESQKDPPFIGMMFHCLVIIPYLVLSDRVLNYPIRSLWVDGDLLHTFNYLKL